MTAGAHQQLVAAATGGDDVALADLVRAYHDRVYRFGLRVCRDGYDADDAVQEAFIELAKRPDVARDAGVLFWLLAVVKHACLRLLRPFARAQKRLGQRLPEDDAVLVDELDAANRPRALAARAGRPRRHRRAQASLPRGADLARSRRPVRRRERAPRSASSFRP